MLRWQCIVAGLYGTRRYRLVLHYGDEDHGVTSSLYIII